METKQSPPPEVGKIFHAQAHEIAVRVDKFFAFLLIIQWFVASAIGLFGPSSMHAVWGAGVGALLSVPVLILTRKFAGHQMLRLLVGCSQIGFSLLFSALTEGRAETQIHIFVSLAALAFYKDIPLLITASEIVALDYLWRAFAGPVIDWRWLELLAWVVVENTILILGILRIKAELWEMALSKYLLQESREEALKLSSSKSNFLSRMSHEIRNPLNTVIGFTDILGDTKLDSEQKDYVGTITRSSEALLHIINDILDISKIESGLLQIDNHKFDMHELHEDIHKMFSPKCEAKGLKLRVILDEKSPRYVEGDSHRLRQILINLVGNAVKFTDHGNVVVEVHHHSAEQKYQWKVADTGRGIDPKNVSKLFRSFYQEDPSVSRRFGGSGLGLMISKNLVEMMGGGIQVESRQGEGTTFLFSLPITESYKETSE